MQRTSVCVLVVINAASVTPGGMDMEKCSAGQTSTATSPDSLGVSAFTQSTGPERRRAHRCT
jgi:hypothetical protein